MPSQTISPVALAVAWPSSVRTTDPSASTTTALTMDAPESVKSTVASSWTPSPSGVRYTSAGPSALIDKGLAPSIPPAAPDDVRRDCALGGIDEGRRAYSIGRRYQ